MNLILHFQAVCAMMWINSRFGTTVRHFSRVSPPRTDCVLRVSSNNITHLGRPKSSHKPRQLLSLPPFPPHPPPGKNGPPDSRMTAISWMKYYFADVTASLIQSHFNKGLVIRIWNVAYRLYRSYSCVGENGVPWCNEKGTSDRICHLCLN